MIRTFAFLTVLIVLGALLGGCGTTPTVIETPIPVSCVERAPERPALVADGDLRAMSDYQLILALWRDRLQRAGYIGELEAVIEACKR